MKRAYELRYYNVAADTAFGNTPNALHNSTSVVNDFFPIQFKVGTDGYAYGFVYRSVRGNPADGLADVFIDFWNSKTDTTAFGTTGSVIMESVSITAQMDVRVFGRLVYVFMEGRSPALFYIKETTERSYVATEDTWLDEQNPTDNNSADLVVDLDNSTALGGSSKHGLLRFDASAQAGLTVLKAELDFQVEEAFLDDVTYKFARPVSAWLEAEADWDEFANGSAWPGGGGAVGDAVTTLEGSLVLLGGAVGQTSGAIGKHTVVFTVGGAGPIDFAIGGTGIVNLLVYPEATQLLENLRRLSGENAINPLARPTLRITYTTNFYELIKVGVEADDPKPGPGLQPTLSSPLTGAVLGGLLPTDFDDTNRAGIGQLVLSVQTPGETGLFPDSSTGLCVAETPPKEGGQEAAGGGGKGFPVIEYQETHVYGPGFPNEFHIFGPNTNFSFTADPEIGAGEKIVIIYTALLTNPDNGGVGPTGSLQASFDHIDYLADGVNVPGNPLASIELVSLWDAANDEHGGKIFMIPNQTPYPKPIGGSAIRITLQIPHVGAVITVMKLTNCLGPTDSSSDEDVIADLQSAIVPGLDVANAGSMAISGHCINDLGQTMNVNDFTVGPGQGTIEKQGFIGGVPFEQYAIHTFRQAPDVVPGLSMIVNWLDPDQTSICWAVVFQGQFGKPPGCPATAAGALALLGFNDGFFGSYKRPPTPLQNAENVPTDNAVMEWTPLKLFPTANGDIGNPANYVPIPNDGNWTMVMTGSKRVGGVDVVLPARPVVDIAAVGFDLTTMEPSSELDDNTTYTFALELTLATVGCGDYIIPAMLSPIHTGVQPLTFTTGGGPQPDARTFAAGDYTFAYILFDSKTGRRSALSEIAQIRAFDFPGNDGQAPDPDDPDPTVPLHFFALEVVYDPGKYDQLLAYRSVNTSASGGLFAAGYLFLDKVVVLEDFQTCENLDGGAFDDNDPDNPLGLKQSIYYYVLEDKQLIYQDSYTDRAVFDTEMPHGGAALMYEGAMLVSKIPDPPLSTTDEIRIHDANRGVGELRWSSLTEVSPELFPPFNRYVPNVETNQIIRMEKVGGSAIGFSLDKLYHIRRHNVYILIQEMHEGLGIVTQRAVASAGSMLYFVTTKGLKAIDGSGRMDDVRHLNSLIIEDWKLTQGDIKVAFDSLAGCLFIHNANPSQWRTAVLWFSTSMITEMHDMVFDDVRTGVWPRVYERTIPDVIPLTSPDFNNELTERALWIQNTPQALHASQDVTFRPRIYYYDYLGSKTMTGSQDAANNGQPAIRTLDTIGDCRARVAGGYVIVGIVTTGSEKYVTVDIGPPDSSGLPRDLHNMYAYIVKAGNLVAIGRKFRILTKALQSGSIWRIIAADNDDFIDFIGSPPSNVLAGDSFMFSPVYVRVVAPNVGIVDPETGQEFGKSFNRARLINSVGAAFTDVKGPPSADGFDDNFFQGLVYEGNLADPTVKRKVVDVEGSDVASVVNGEGVDYAGFGSLDVDVEGQYGIKGNALSPALEVFCPDLDFRLLEMVARGKILGIERSRITRSV